MRIQHAKGSAVCCVRTSYTAAVPTTSASVSMDTPGTEYFVYTVRRVQKHLLPHFTVGVGFKTAYYAQ